MPSVIIPIHRDDRGLLNMHWHGSICLDAALPFGLCSALKMFSAVAEALLWIIYTNDVTSRIHDLGDYFLGSPDSDECALNLSETMTVPVTLHKLEGPTTR